MPERPHKAESALRTISELSDELGVPQHVLRYWETRFPQLRPMQRAGRRRYYRPEDVALARHIHRLLNTEGYTVKGVRQLLAAKAPPPPQPEPAPAASPAPDRRAALIRIRARLADALAADRA